MGKEVDDNDSVLERKDPVIEGSEPSYTDILSEEPPIESDNSRASTVVPALPTDSRPAGGVREDQVSMRLEKNLRIVARRVLREDLVFFN